MKDKWEIIGRIFIDSGTILLCDPCRLQNDIDFMQEAMAMGNVLRYRQIGDNTAVLSRTGLGDGEYEVEANTGDVPGWGVRVKEIRIRFVGPGTVMEDVPGLEEIFEAQEEFKKLSGKEDRKKDPHPELAISAKEYFESLNLCAEHLAEKRQALLNANALIEEDGEERILVSRYGSYISNELTSKREKAEFARSDEDIEDFKSVARMFMDEWITLLSHIAESEPQTDPSMTPKRIRTLIGNISSSTNTIFLFLQLAFDLSLASSLSEHLRKKDNC